MKRYKTIFLDPPWPEYGGGKIKRGADRHYPLMKISEITALGSFINKIAEDNCHLYMWVTNNYLPKAFQILEAWGFRYITIVTWKKDRMGLGQYFRGITEHCIFAVKGKLPYKVVGGKRQQGVTGFDAPRRQHSQKPERMREMIEKVSYPPFVEIFARPKEATDDMFAEPEKDIWDYIGDEIDGVDIRSL